MISFWYKREESQRRFTLFWSSVLFASMFGGLLASAIAHMQGVRGYSSWRWVFILEGIATIVIGILAYFLVADFPTDARWLSAEEREFVIARTATDDDSASPITAPKVVSFFGDVKNLIGGFMYFGKVYSCTCSHELWLISLTGVIVPIYCAFFFLSPNIDRLMMQISLLVLCPHNSQDPRLLGCTDPTTHSPTSCSCPSPLSHLRLSIRSPPPPLPFHIPRFPNHYSWPCDPTHRPPQLPRAIPRYMSSRHGLLLCRSHNHLLVPHEPERTHAAEHR